MHLLIDVLLIAFVVLDAYATWKFLAYISFQFQRLAHERMVEESEEDDEPFNLSRTFFWLRALIAVIVLIIAIIAWTVSGEISKLYLPDAIYVACALSVGLIAAVGILIATIPFLFRRIFPCDCSDPELRKKVLAELNGFLTGSQDEDQAEVFKLHARTCIPCQEALQKWDRYIQGEHRIVVRFLGDQQVANRNFRLISAIVGEHRSVTDEGWKLWPPNRRCLRVYSGTLFHLKMFLVSFPESLNRGVSIVRSSLPKFCIK